MILEATDKDFVALLKGVGPRGLRLVPDSAIAEPEVLQMLADLADSVARVFTPAAWLVVQDDEVVGLVSLIAPPDDGVIQIGYGIAPTRQARGHATGAIRDLVRWARAESRITGLRAETHVSNIASQRVLSGNDFSEQDRRHDPEDGDLICWTAEAGA